MGSEGRRGLLAGLGPAIIVGSVVLGPGSILVSSKVGCEFGYDLLWVVVAAAVLMAGMTVLSARLGVELDGTPCDELAARAGRPAAAVVGMVLFAIVACFQFSNNIGVLAALEPLLGLGPGASITLLIALNLGVGAALFGLRRLYRRVEVLMKVLVGLMILGFLGNLALARPSVASALGGLVPALPEAAAADLWQVQGLIGTTFSVAAAFYTAYLVREKGWTGADARRGLVDAVTGISILALLSMVLMVTAASVLHGEVESSELATASDVARVLEPLFGKGAVVLFCTGLLAGAFSSFLVNAMIGGTVLSDGLGLGGRMDQPWPKVFTVAALATGLVVAIVVHRTGHKPVDLVVFAQALTVLGNPVLAAVLLLFALRLPSIPLRGLAACGFALVLVLAVRTASRLLQG